MYALGIDLGTTFTAAAVRREGHAEICSLGSHGAAIPSVVLLREDETLLTGEAANRRALTMPHRVAREFKRRLGDTTPILLGGAPYSAEALMGRMLRAVVEEVSTREGGAPSAVCISHPANWGPFKTDLLRQAVRSADLDDVRFASEPEAAAVFYASQARVPDDAMIGVYDLGGGTFDAAVLRKTTDGFALLGRPEGIERLGGIDFDAAVYAHVAHTVGAPLAELDEDDPAAMAAVSRLREECIRAKEALSADTDTSIPVLLPNLSTEVRLTRGELESMIRPALQDTIDAMRRALRSAEVSPEQLHAVLLVGGSSRMPMVAQLVGAELGRPVAVDAHPKHAIALGAAWLAGSAPSTEVTATDVPAPADGERAKASGAAGALPLAVAAGMAAGSGTEDPGTAAAGSTAAEDTPTVVSPPPSGPDRAGTGPTGASHTEAAAPDPHLTPLSDPGPKQGAPGGREQLVPGSGVPARRGRAGSGARRGLGAAVAVVAVALLAGGAAAAVRRNLASDSSGPSPTTTTSDTRTSASAAAVPADEQCTEAIMANPRWVCLTRATFDGKTLTVEYRADFADDTPNVKGGYHLHIYGGDGTTPAEETEGMQASDPGRWYVEDENPSVRPASSKDYRTAVGDAPKVCARIADSAHRLVTDQSGGYHTGNCVPIERTGTATTTTAPTAPRTSASTRTPRPTWTAPTQEPTPTGTTTPTDTGDPEVTPTSTAPSLTTTP